MKDHLLALCILARKSLSGICGWNKGGSAVSSSGGRLKGILASFREAVLAMGGGLYSAFLSWQSRPGAERSRADVSVACE